MQEIKVFLIIFIPMSLIFAGSFLTIEWLRCKFTMRRERLRLEKEFERDDLLEEIKKLRRENEKLVKIIRYYKSI